MRDDLAGDEADVVEVGQVEDLEVHPLRAGIAEVIKHGFALDAAFVAWLESNIEKILKRDRAALAYAVRRSCELKAKVVAADEREAGERALLNFGHTFGHAIETSAGYGAWLHGEAVAAGMVMAAELSALMGDLRKAEVSRVRELLGRAGKGEDTCDRQGRQGTGESPKAHGPDMMAHAAGGRAAHVR